MGALELDRAQKLVATECARRWPDVTIMRESLALGEEVGEMYRCIVKRDEGTRGTPEEWTEQLKLECGQALGVLLTVMALEGWKASDCFSVAMRKFYDKPMSEDMNLEVD